MTQYELHKKIEAIQTSEAPYEVKQQAIDALLAKHDPNYSTTIAKAQIEESLPDYDNLIGD
jgi:hypothetical protein